MSVNIFQGQDRFGHFRWS